MLLNVIPAYISVLYKAQIRAAEKPATKPNVVNKVTALKALGLLGNCFPKTANKSII